MQRVRSLEAMIICSGAFVLGCLASTGGAEEIALYVSPDGNDTWAGDSLDKPLATLQGARDAVRNLKKQGELTQPVTVYVRGGTYELSETLVFTIEDSGTKSSPITYRAYQDETPVISGGRRIAGPWEDYRGEIKVCTLPEVQAGKWRFRQLFLSGERQTRARFPNNGFYVIGESDEDLERDVMPYQPSHFQAWKNLGDVEVVLFHFWNESRLLVSELDEEDSVVTFTGRIGRRLGSGGERNRYYIDNVLEGLDQPGEWYLDRHAGKLYYWPVEGWERKEMRAPVLNELVRFEGDVPGKKHVQYITLRGFTFCDADYILPEAGIPTIRDPGDIWFPAAITLKGVSDCVFENNTVRNVGTYGIDLTGDGNLITGNHIHDTGSGGIITRSYGLHRNIISYNHIHDCGSVLQAAVGINIDDGGGLIANNLVHNTSHSGIYGRHFASAYGQEHERRNQKQGLIIEYNEIYDVMSNSNDGAGIFIRDDYIVIRNNLIHDVISPPQGHGSPAWGIYLGCETRNCLVENNVVYRTEAGQHVWFQSKNNTIYNNIFIDGGRTQVGYNNPGNAHHERIRLLRNILCFSNPSGSLYTFGRESSLPMESDHNLIFHTQGKDIVIGGISGVDSFASWQDRGFDTHSIVADPLFVDPDNDDYSLRPESPAFKLGFKPIDLSRVGIRGRESK